MVIRTIVLTIRNPDETVETVIYTGDVYLVLHSSWVSVDEIISWKKETAMNANIRRHKRTTWPHIRVLGIREELSEDLND